MIVLPKIETPLSDFEWILGVCGLWVFALPETSAHMDPAT
jgi:hypothetical protein